MKNVSEKWKKETSEVQERENRKILRVYSTLSWSSEGSGLLSSTDHNFSDTHAGYNVHREAFNKATVISGDLFHEPHALVVRL